MKKIILLIGIMGAVCLSSCTKHEYCECSYKTPIKGTIIKQIFHIEDMTCDNFLPEGWEYNYDKYLKPKCVKIDEEQL